MKPHFSIENIIKGWFFSLIYAPKNIKRMSFERLQECNKCEVAIPSTVLKFIKGNAVEEKCKKCMFCGCPTYEKSLVKEEKCELNKWKL